MCFTGFISGIIETLFPRTFGGDGGFFFAQVLLLLLSVVAAASRGQDFSHYGVVPLKKTRSALSGESQPK